MKESKDRGFVFVATGEGYLREARQAAEAVRRCHPEIAICLITDLAIEERGPFTDILVPEEPVVFGPIDKLLAIHCPYDRAVLLDTDTLTLDRLDDLFLVLDRFDLALLPETKRGWNYDMPDVPAAFAEFNTGVVAFRKTAAVEQFFARWRQEYGTLHTQAGIVNDQPSFRRTLYHSDLRVASLPSEYHFLGNVPNYIMWKAKLIHARGDLSAIGASVNESPGPRVFVPDVGTISSFHGRRHWAGVWARTMWRMFKLLCGRPTRATELNPGKWWLNERR